MKENYLMSSLRIRLYGLNLAKACKALENYPRLKLIAKGSILRYAIEEAQDYFYVFELGRDSLTFTIFSKQTPIYFFNDMLLRVFNILQIIDCNVDLRSVFPYVIFALARQHAAYALSQLPQPKPAQTDVELLLAKRTKELLNENADLKRSEQNLKDKTASMLALLVIAYAEGTASRKQLAEKFEVGEDELNTAIELLPKYGYRAVFKTFDTFELVSI
ncbi:MAG: hypothetical protein ACP5T4_01940 [Candidatus Micrarchaeia archaeon]